VEGRGREGRGEGREGEEESCPSFAPPKYFTLEPPLLCGRPPQYAPAPAG